MKIVLRFPLFMIIAVVFLAGSCKLEELPKPIIIPNNIKKEFYIDLQEYLHPTNRQLRFMIKTIESQDCQNSSVATDYVVAGRNITLSINDIVPPADCVEGTAPAKTDVYAGELANGSYNLEIALRNLVVNNGRLTVSGESYTINMETQEGITLLHNSLLKIPNDAFWGYVVCDESEWEALQQELDHKLTGLATPANDIYRDGFYGHFELNSNTSSGRSVFLVNPPSADFHFPILYQLAAGVDESRLRTLIEEFKDAHPDISMQGRNAEGRIF
jgi:hypothetical protein